MPQNVRIALDAMGGDHGAAVVVAGADISLERHPDTEFVMIGSRTALEPLLVDRLALRAVSRIVHTDVAGKMDDKPSQALRHCRWETSLWGGVDAGKKAEADGAISAGHNRRPLA